MEPSMCPQTNKYRIIISYLSGGAYRNHNLTFTIPIASNMARERINILHQDCPAAPLSGRTTHALPDPNGLARDLPHKGAKHQPVRRVRGIQHVEARPVHSGRWRGKRVVQVP